jgi:O-antigen ligase
VSGGISITTRDLIDLPRYLVVGAVFVIMGNVDPDRLRAAAERLMFVSLLFSLMVLFVYLLDVPLLSDMVRWLYEDTKTAISFPRWVRLAAPFENPNFLSFYAVLCLAYSLFFTSGKRRLVLTILALLVLVATGSRSGWVSAVVLIIGLFARIVPGVFNTRRSILRQDVLFLVLFALLTSCLLWFLYPYLLESVRVKMVISALEEGGLFHEPNVAGRMDMVVEAFRVFAQRPIFGWGPFKGGPLEVIDNQYFLVLARQGFVGFILLMSIMLYVFSGAVKLAHTRADKFGVVLMWFVVALMLMTGAFLNNFRLLVLFIFFVVASTGTWTVNAQGASVARRSP